LADALNAVYPKGDKTGLNALIAVVEGLDSARYTPASWAPVGAALTAAIAIRDLADATVDEVDAAFAALSDAVANLVLRAAKAGLASAISVAQAILGAPGRYVPASLSGLPQALADAQAAYADDDATPADVSSAQTALIAKIAAARLIPTGGGSPAPMAAPAMFAAAAAAPAEAAEVLAAAGSAPADGVGAAPVAPAKFAKAPAPKVVGVAKVGHRLKAKTGSWSPAPSFSYQWYRSGKAIAKATKATYKVTKADRGKRISVKVKAVSPGYKAVAKASAKTKKVR
jgi:hypothetical protein